MHLGVTGVQRVHIYYLLLHNHSCNTVFHWLEMNEVQFCDSSKSGHYHLILFMRPSQEGGGVPVPLYWNKLASHPVRQIPKICFAYVPCSPILSLLSCLPENLAFVPLIP